MILAGLLASVPTKPTLKNYLILFRVGGYLKPSLPGTSGVLRAAVEVKITLAVDGQ